MSRRCARRSAQRIAAHAAPRERLLHRQRAVAQLLVRGQQRDVERLAGEARAGAAAPRPRRSLLRRSHPESVHAPRAYPLREITDVNSGAISRWQRPCRLPPCRHDMPEADQGHDRRRRRGRAGGADRAAQPRRGARRRSSCSRRRPTGAIARWRWPSRSASARRKRYDLVQIARDHGAALHLAGVQIGGRRRAPADHLGRSGSSAYEILLIAVGAQPDRRGPRQHHDSRAGLHRPLPDACCASSSERRIRRVAFAVPAGASWPLPLYELALMTAAHVAERGLRKLRAVARHPRGRSRSSCSAPPASAAVRELLDERGDRVPRRPLSGRGARRRARASCPAGTSRPSASSACRGCADRSLPGCRTIPRASSPSTCTGSSRARPTSTQPATRPPARSSRAAWRPAGGCRRRGDRRTRGRAGRAEARSGRCCAGCCSPGAPRSSCAPRSAAGADHSGGRSTHALWWPPSKIAGRWLAPYLAQRHDELEHEPAGLRVEAEAPFPTARRALIGRDAAGRSALAPVDTVMPSKR